jgi:hypothetical protein
MSVWTWIKEYAEAADEAADQRKQNLLAAYDSGRQKFERLPDDAVAEFERGRQLAVALNEPWWALFFEHWKLQALLHCKYDNRRAMELAVTVSLEARKSPYQGCPQRLCVHDDLITSYLSLDAPGYAGEVEEALAYMEQEVQEDFECRYCLLQRRCELTEALGNLDAFEKAVVRLLAKSQEQGEDHHALSGHAWMCLVAYRKGTPEQIAQSAAEGLVICDKIDRPVLQAELVTWQAYLARLKGDDDAAAKRLRWAAVLLSRTQRQPGNRYYIARCAYHALKQEREQELAVREQELLLLADKNQYFWEANARIEHCRLLSELGRPAGEALAQARQVIGKLRRPAALLARLAEIEGSGAAQTP